MSRIDIELMRRFLCVAKEGNISRAAEQLYISQQAVSASMSKLEKELGYELFDARSDGVQLTELGRRCYPVISSVVKKYDSGLEILRGFADKREQTLSVLLEFQNFPYILPRDLFTKIGDLTVQSVVADSYKQCLQDIKSGKFDLAIIVWPEIAEELSEFAYIPLRSQGLNILVNRNNPLSEKKEIRIEDLKEEEFILPCSEYALVQPFINACLAHDFYPNFSREVIGLPLCLQAVSEGQGILITPDLGDALKSYKEIVSCFLPYSEVHMELGVLARKDYQDHIMIRSYINALKIMMEEYYYNF